MAALWVFVGGGSGAVLRWWFSELFTSPWGTVVVNLIGSFLLAALAHPGADITEPTRLALAVGALGGFTTYSTFNLDLLKLLHSGDYKTAILQFTITVVGAMIAGTAGWSLAGWMRSGTVGL